MLNDDVWHEIFLFVSWKDLHLLSKTCQYLHRLSRDEIQRRFRRGASNWYRVAWNLIDRRCPTDQLEYALQMGKSTFKPVQWNRLALRCLIKQREERRDKWMEMEQVSLMDLVRDLFFTPYSMFSQYVEIIKTHFEVDMKRIKDLTKTETIKTLMGSFKVLRYQLEAQDLCSKTADELLSNPDQLQQSLVIDYTPTSVNSPFHEALHSKNYDLVGIFLAADLCCFDDDYSKGNTLRYVSSSKDDCLTGIFEKYGFLIENLYS